MRGQHAPWVRASDSAWGGGHVHYRLHIPDNCGERITLHAKIELPEIYVVQQPVFVPAWKMRVRRRRGDAAHDDRKWRLGRYERVAGKIEEVRRCRLRWWRRYESDSRDWKKESAPARRQWP